MLKEILDNAAIFYLWQIFDQKEYSMQRYSEWRNEYWEDEEISETIKKIGDLLETRVVVGALKKELHPTMTIFHLKNNFKWTDKVLIDQNNTNTINAVDFWKEISNSSE